MKIDYKVGVLCLGIKAGSQYGAFMTTLTDDERSTFEFVLLRNIKNFYDGVMINRQEKESDNGMERQNEGMGRG